MSPKSPYPKTIQALCQLVADTYALMLKTHNYHWNVTGPEFHTLHAMFESQYTELFEAADLIAERIRALGELAPATYTEFNKLSKIKEGNSKLSAHDMTQDLCQSHEIMIKTLHDAIQAAANENDTVSQDVFITRQKSHEKTRWMLHATSEGWKK